MNDAAHRVLVADAERFFREAIAEALGEAGIACDVAVSAAEALRAVARDSRIGVAVVDLALDGGVELLRRLRGERPAIRVIALAGEADQERVLEALRLGAADYLAKPLHDEELVLAVRRALAGFATETGYERLRGRLRSLDAWLAELAEAAQVGGEAALSTRAADAVADVLGATKTSIMLLETAEGPLRVVAATGSSLAPEEMDAVELGEGVAGVAVSMDEVLAVDDVTRDARFSERPFRHRYESGALAVAPLHDADRPLGVLCASDREGGAPFGDDERTLLRVLASQIASLLARVRHGELAAPEDTAPLRAWQDRADPDAELGREVCEALCLEVEPQRLLAAALLPVARRLHASPVSLYLIDSRSGELALEGISDADGRVDRARLPRNRGLCATVLQTGHLVASGRPQADPRFDPGVDTPEDGSAGPLLCVPIRLRGKVLGLARAFPKEPAAASARTGEMLAAGLSAVVRNVLLYRSLLEAIEDLARARRDAGGRR
jgi:DNA-binding NarL/FixJ family response regulator/putative methionine-R-sulfoxide reductase with GAF domain